VKVERFKTYFADLMRADQNPGVESVETYKVAGEAPDSPLRDIKITGTDGVTLYLRVVRGAADGEGLWGAEEKILTKPERGVQIIEE
jgi:hypothetical protein